MNRITRMTGILPGMILLGLFFFLIGCKRKEPATEKLQDYSHMAVSPAPDWARKGVLYEVFPRVFSEEGTFKGIETRLDYIEQLGVDVIWLMPIFPIGEKGRKGTMGSPYAVKDFRSVNPDYGTEEDFRDLVHAIHSRGMKIILGMVPNHGANDNILTETHPEWFMRNEKGEFIRENEDWSDVIDFDYSNPGLREYMTETLIYWIEKFDIDGYRCDVAGMVPNDFWKSALSRLREIKPDVYLLAEWEDPEIVLAGFDSDYGWSEYHILRSIREGKDRTSSIIRRIEEKENKYPHNALIMRFLENHDELRSMKRFGTIAIEAYATILFTLPGIPLIYAGQEIGETVKPPLFEKSVLNWTNRDEALLELYRELIHMRKEWPCFSEGTFMQLPTASMSGS
ncbi:MAG: alpha-amylase, partial [Calditrichaeota bacterium]